ncbi:MAG TPA: tetratricopeptide repeat protein [Edaphobacter sp.]
MAQSRAAKRRTAPPHWTETLPAWVWLLVIASWTILLYGRILQAPFVYDDLAQIVRNPNLTDWHNVFTRFLAAPVGFSTEFLATSQSGSSYRPLYWLSLALDRRLWGLSPAGFHFTNLLLHGVNGALLFHLLRRLRIGSLAALAATLLWISLPINSEAVAWISARAYSLCFFFLLISLLATLRYLEGRSFLALFAGFLTAVASLLSHESGILIFPLAAVALLLRSREDLSASRNRPALILLLGVDLAAVALFFYLRHAVGAHSAIGPATPKAFASILWKYIGWILLPLHMSVERSTSTPANALSVFAISAWIALSALIAGIVLLWKRIPSASFGIAWLLLALAPFCGLVFLYQGMAERFCYIASAGAAVAVVALIAPQKSQIRIVLVSIALLWAGWSIFRLETRLSDWNSPAQLFRSSLEATPDSPSLWFNLGFTLREEGNLPEAATAYQSSIRLNPKYQRAYSSLGETYARMGRVEDAGNAYRQALALNRNDAGTTLNLAVTLHQAHQDEEAERIFRQAIALAPNDSGAYTDLGVLLYQQGKVEEAESMFLNAMDHNPADPTPYSDLALLYQQSGHPALAITLYQKLLVLRPNDPDALANLQRLQKAR